MAAHEALIYSAVRTPIGRLGGALAGVRPDDLAAVAIAEAMRRSGLDPELLEDVILGCANQAGEDNRNVARMASLLAGLPIGSGGQTVNRLCGSGLQAVITASHAIRADEGRMFLAGGVESMTRAPFVMGKADKPWSRDLQVHDTSLGWRFVNPRLAELHHPYAMGETAENVAERYGISREDQDAFAIRSQQAWERAQQHELFADELVPVSVPGRKKGEVLAVSVDEHPRPETNLEGLARLKPAFRQGGTVTAGNASGLNDGAAALVVASEALFVPEGVRPLARVAASAVAGVDPAVMGVGPVPAVRKALARAGLSVGDLAAIELNEAFAAQALACIRELDLDPDRVNPLGGAIALGHPLGMSGARILTTLVHHLRRTRGRFGLATMCVGVGQGIALIIENLDA
ncbi:MAG: acetyl-CoA C-acyltransferase [Candidatus Sericytochromatia bacterium]|nr:acetyl-CoA C-acyltransferase [Candidatus Sericytochromatia bacterium]